MGLVTVLLAIVDLARVEGLAIEAIGALAALTALLLVRRSRPRSRCRTDVRHGRPTSVGQAVFRPYDAAGSGGGCIAAPGSGRGEGRRAGFFSGSGAASGSASAGSSAKTDCSSSPARSRSN